MFRVYRTYRAQREQVEAAHLEQLVEQAMQDARQEQARRPMTEEEIMGETERLARYGARQAAALGIKDRDIDRIVYEEREKQRRRTPADRS